MFLKTLFALTLAAAAMGNSEKPSASSKKKPSFVFSMTDDQDKLLDSMQALPLTKKKIGQQGTTYDQHFCTIAICCPSRVSLLTGKMAHNTNVTDVAPPYGN
tara:strand:- start:904 stop:1209 length:306 start_codon:yes stop_codon:yes gene_type:complete